MSQAQGLAAELLAKKYLEHQGLVWRESNYHSRMGEIDLIMLDKTHLVFVEVRSRKSASFGGALESITASKRQKIMKTASAYLQKYALDRHYSSRFDVVVLQGDPVTIQWIQNAFGSDY